MRVYHGAPSPENLRRCREAAPSHVHGACWTPAKMTPHEWPYFIDCGAFGGNFDREEWLALLDRVDDRMPHAPDFVVLPDVFNDAEATLERHRVHADDVLSRGFDPAPVLQPGLPVASQVAIADGFGAETVFVGGEVRWQRAHAEEIVDEADDRGLRVHIGNPGDSESLAWAYRVGFDSVDTSSVLQNQYFHWLENLETETHSSRGSGKKGGRQQQLVTDGGEDVGSELGVERLKVESPRLEIDEFELTPSGRPDRPDARRLDPHEYLDNVTRAIHESSSEVVDETEESSLDAFGGEAVAE